MQNNFIDRVWILIENKTARESITAELESHILDKADYYEEIGYSREVAIQKATEEMGNPDDTAVPLNALYKSSVFKNIGTILSVILIVVMLYFGNTHCNSFNYAYNDLFHAHYVKYDFLSFAIFAGYAVLLYFARRKKNKLIALLIIDSFAVELLLMFIIGGMFRSQSFMSADVTTLFQPLAYALVMIVISGFSGYIDSIFSYSFIALPPEGTAIYKGIATTLFVFLVVWAIAVYVEISRQEKMKPTKVFRKPLKYSHYIVTVLLSLNFIVMSVGTAVAYSDIDYKINETMTVREHMIDCLLNAEISSDYEEQLNYLAKSGYNATQDIRFDLHDTPDAPCIFLYNGNMLRLFSNENDGDFYTVTVSATSSEASIVEKALLCDSADREELSNYGYGTSLDEFIWSRIYSKAYEVERIFYDNSDIDDEVIPDYEDSVYFYFRFDSGEYINVTFENGELTENTALDNVIQVKHQRQQIIDCITCQEVVVGTNHYAMLNGGYDVLESKIADFASIGINMTDTSDDGSKDYYENADDYNRVILDAYRETGEYLYEYYSTTVEDYDNVLNDKLYFTREDFSNFELGMDYYDFAKLDNNYFYSNAACVICYLKFDEEKMEYTDKVIYFIYAVKDEKEGVLKKYVLTFENGKLTDKNLIGLFSEVTPVVGLNVLDDPI